MLCLPCIMGMHSDLILPMPRKIIAELEQRETRKEVCLLLVTRWSLSKQDKGRNNEVALPFLLELSHYRFLFS
jgi:hypothetical protein